MATMENARKTACQETQRHLAQKKQTIQQFSILGISVETWLTIAAIIIGPAVALALQRYSERRRAVKL